MDRIDTPQAPFDQQLILVDRLDRVLGYAEKQLAHESSGTLHRAFSVLIFNSRGEMLLQLRSVKKYHFGGLWSNACCGHPTRGAQTHAAAERRLEEEFGFQVPLRERFSFIYQAHDEASGLTEHEFDRVYTGIFDGVPVPNPDEIDRYRWVNVDELRDDLQRNADSYTPWFRIMMENAAAWSAT